MGLIVGGICFAVFVARVADEGAALIFFVLGWLTVGLASIDLLRRPDPCFPRWLAVIGALAMVCFVPFMAALFTDPHLGEDALAAPGMRPDVSPASILEWSVVAAIVAWRLATALAWIAADRRAAAAVRH